MKRIAFFAHYDRDGIIDDYVIYYLRGLKHVADRILLVSDSNLREGEAARLEGLAELVSARPHGEYDFGSWKRCLAHLNFDLAGWDELILANDSCYAPIYPFEDVFERMSLISCDFWSPNNTQIKDEFDHLSSYFLVLRGRLLQDTDFLKFWERVEPQPNVDAVVKEYETGLSQLLARNGYSYASLLPAAEVGSFLKTDYIHKNIHSYRSSWLKVRLLRDNPFYAIKINKALNKIASHYPVELVEAHLIRTLGTAKPEHHLRIISGNWRFRRYGLEISCNLKRGKPHKQKNRHFNWIKLYTYVFGVPVFAFSWPVRRI